MIVISPFQGVLKVRKRVTLMVGIVSAIFVICWGTDTILHTLEDVGSYKLSPFAIPIAHTMIMFNAAVNPFAYALINQRFRQKINRMCCVSRLSKASVNSTREARDIKLANGNTQSIDTAKPNATYSF